ncbi:hypothetical protein BTVI_112047 [Pitangus sulphuratus]|nr:hypothetical protein BTVI_112047 [Pitangus sulphuratus]
MEELSLLILPSFVKTALVLKPQLLSWNKMLRVGDMRFVDVYLSYMIESPEKNYAFSVNPHKEMNLGLNASEADKAQL